MNAVALARIVIVDDEAAQMRAQPERELRRHFQLGHNRAVRAPVFLQLPK